MISNFSLDTCLNALQAAANLGGTTLVSFTRGINEVVGSTPVDAWMDSVEGIGHRVAHGHSLDYLPAIFEKFGWSGILDYFSHGLKDVMSPHGMPMPFAKEIADLMGLAPLQAVKWLSFNIGDLVSIGFSIPHT